MKLQRKFIRKVFIVEGIFASFLLFIGGCLLSLSRFLIYAENLNSYYYQKILEVSVRGKEIRNAVVPIVLFPSDYFETPQSAIWIKVLSNKELETGSFGEYSIWFAEREDGSSFYPYYIFIDNLSDIEEDFELSIFDKEGNEVRKTLAIKNCGEVLGSEDTREEKLIPSGDDLLTVLDWEYALPYYYQPSDLVSICNVGIPCIGGDHQLRNIVVEDLAKMIDEAKSAGYTIYVLSAFRSFDTQYNLYRDMTHIVLPGYVDTLVARPGHSEHQLATAIDITCGEVLRGETRDLADSEVGKWLAANAHKHGFVMSYPKRCEALTGYRYEPWHYRYVGVENAEKIYESGQIPFIYLQDLQYNKS